MSQLSRNQVVEELFQRLDTCLRNAHYWMREQGAMEQAAQAIMEARGALKTIREKLELDENERRCSGH